MDKNELIEMAKDFTAYCLKNQGRVPACIMGVKGRDTKATLIDISCLMGNKDMAASVIAKCRGNMPVMVFLTEAWLVKSEKGKAIDENVAPSQHPDRYEAVTLCVYQGLETELHIGEMLRVGSEVFVRDWQDMNGAKPSGRMFRTPGEWN